MEKEGGLCGDERVLLSGGALTYKDNKLAVCALVITRTEIYIRYRHLRKNKTESLSPRNLKLECMPL